MPKLKAIFLAFVIGAVAIAGGILIFSSGGASTQSGEFTPVEAAAALRLDVRPPAAPFSPASLLTEGIRETYAAAVKDDALYESVLSTDPCSGNLSSDFSCYELLYIKIVTEEGLKAAFADLKVRYSKNEYVKSQCHPLTHVLGRIAVQTFPDISDAYKEGDSFCWSGYYHGVLETVMSRIGLRNAPQQLNTLCKKLNDGKYSFDYFNCVHGIGHGLMAITDDELFQSLKYCDGLTGDWEQESCAGGVYMENVIADGLNHTTGYLDPRRPHFPCDQSPDKYKNTCYLMQTSYMLKINNSDFEKTFVWCREAGEHAPMCFQSLGRDASSRTVSDAKKTHDICALGRDVVEIGNCAIGATKDFVSYFHSDKQALEFCGLFTDKDIRTLCRNVTGDYYKTF